MSDPTSDDGDYRYGEPFWRDPREQIAGLQRRLTEQAKQIASLQEYIGELEKQLEPNVVQEIRDELEHKAACAA